MTVSLHQTRGVNKVFIDLGEHDRRYRRGIREALYDIGEIVSGEIRRSILIGPKTGRLYRRPGGRIHRASAPGEAPATDTGALIASVDFEVHSWARMEVGDKEPYGRHLELGARRTLPAGGTVRIEPRPHVRPAVERTGTIAQVLLQERVISRVARS